MGRRVLSSDILYRRLTLCGIRRRPRTFLPHPLASLLHIPKWVPSAFGTSPRRGGAGKAHHFPVNTFLLACADPYIPELQGTGRCRVDFLSEQPRPRFSSLPWTLIYSPSRLMGDGGYFPHPPRGDHGIANGVEMQYVGKSLKMALFNEKHERWLLCQQLFLNALR